MATINLTIYHGKDATLRFNLTSLPVAGLAGATVYFKAKRDKTDAEAAALLSKDSTSSAQINIVAVGSDTVDGVIDVFLLRADTSALLLYTIALFYDIVVRDGTGKDYHVGDGLLTIEAGVNQSV